MRTLVLRLDPSVLRAADEILSSGQLPPVEEEDEGYVPSLYDLLDLDWSEPEYSTAVDEIFPQTPEAPEPANEEVETLMCFETLESSDTENGVLCVIGSWWTGFRMYSDSVCFSRYGGGFERPRV